MYVQIIQIIVVKNTVGNNLELKNIGSDGFVHMQAHMMRI